MSDQQSFRGVCSHALREAASLEASEGSLISIIQLNPTTGKLFTVIYSNCALRLKVVETDPQTCLLASGPQGGRPHGDGCDVMKRGGEGLPVRWPRRTLGRCFFF